MKELNKYSKEELIEALMLIKEEVTKVSKASDVFAYLSEYCSKEQEHFLLISLDSQNNIIAKDVIFKGTVNTSIVSPREIFLTALKREAVRIIIAHNHPSGDLTPSSQDDRVTSKIKEAGNILDIQLLDHIIISKNGYYSYEEEGRLFL